MSEIKRFLETYPYLGTALLVLSLSFGGFVMFRSRRTEILLSGLLALPFATWAIVLVPEYWTPRLWLGYGRIGLEDFVWAFGTGCLVWLSAAIATKSSLTMHPRFTTVLCRYAIVSAIGLSVFAPLWIFGIKVMGAFVASVVTLGIFLGCIRPNLWRLAVYGGFGFGLINLLVTKAAVLFCPAYYQQVALGALSGLTFWDLPIEEVYWAFASGATWALLIGFVLDVRRTSPDLSSESPPFL